MIWTKTDEATASSASIVATAMVQGVWKLGHSLNRRESGSMGRQTEGTDKDASPMKVRRITANHGFSLIN